MLTRRSRSAVYIVAVFGACAGGSACSGGGQTSTAGSGDCTAAVCECNPGDQGACYSGNPSTKDVGACKRGTQTCSAVGVFEPCDGEILPAAETCNGKDDDCNGSIDEGCACSDGDTQPCYSGPGGTQGVGSCKAGTQPCTGGQWGPCAGEVGPHIPEICDGQDDDCNGKVDDNLAPIVCGVGACQATPKCVNGALGMCQPGQPAPETCNGADDDCDGTIDEGVAPTTCGVGACAVTVAGCLGGQPAPCVPNAPTPEVCDGLDNDCDGVPDEGDPGGGGSCVTGQLGACSAGTLTCSGGAVKCLSNTPAAAEVCTDGLDNDCNGKVDNGCGDWVCSSAIGGTGYEKVNGVAADSSGNIIVAGQFYPTTNIAGQMLTSAGDNDVFLAKFSPNCQLLWAKRFGGTDDEIVNDIAVDMATGNVFVTGYAYGATNLGGGMLPNAGGADLFITKYLSTGSFAWGKLLGGASYDNGTAVAVTSNGDVVVLGTFYGTANFGGPLPLTSSGAGDLAIARYSGVTGSHLWSKSVGGSSSDEYAGDVAIDSGNNIIMIGYSDSSSFSLGGNTFVGAGGSDIFLAKYDTNGIHSWSKSFGTVADEYGYGVAVDMGGNVVLTGRFFASLDLSAGMGQLVGFGGVDVFLARFSPAGAHLWSKAFGGPGNDYNPHVTVDKTTGNIFFSGSYSNGITGPYLGGVVPLPVYGCSDVFLAKYMSSGMHIWSKGVGGANCDSPGGIDALPGGKVVLGGDFDGVADLGMGLTLSAGGQDGFYAVYGP